MLPSLPTGHRKPVTGIACDANNRRVVTSSIDGTIKLWDFNDARCLSTVDIGSPVSRMLLHASNNLLAVAADDLCVRIVDVDTAKVVREFWGHDGRVTDMVGEKA